MARCFVKHKIIDCGPLVIGHERDCQANGHICHNILVPIWDPTRCQLIEERIELLASLNAYCATHRPHHREQEDAIKPLQFCLLIQGSTCKPQLQVKSDVKHLDSMHLVKQTFMLLHSMSSLDVHMTLITKRDLPLWNRRGTFQSQVVSLKIQNKKIPSRH